MNHYHEWNSLQALSYYKQSNVNILICQVLVMFSDGLDEDVIRVKQESELLRQSGKNWEAEMYIVE